MIGSVREAYFRDKSNRSFPNKSDDVMHRVPGDHDRGESINFAIASIFLTQEVAYFSVVMKRMDEFSS
jgi:hypothetical protein